MTNRWREEQRIKESNENWINRKAPKKRDKFHPWTECVSRRNLKELQFQQQEKERFL